MGGVVGSAVVIMSAASGRARRGWSDNGARTLAGVARTQNAGDDVAGNATAASHPPAARTTVAAASPPSAVPGFDAFFERYEQPLYGYLRRMLPSDESALEIAQEAFFRAWQHFDELRCYDRPEAWLYRVATNLAISHLRRKRAFSFSQIFKRSGTESDPSELVGEHELLADSLDLERQTAERDLIVRVLQRLPERQRAALLLRAVYGHSCAEVAQTLDISLPNARQTLSRGRERFRRLYEAAQRESGA